MELRGRLWHVCYELLARRVRQREWAFMNYGFATASGRDEGLRLDPADEADRFSIQLYAHVVPDDLTGLDVLEVGCGRGGGAGFLSRYRNAASTTGVDRSAAGVALCRRDRSGPGLTFTTGDAQALPFRDASFDVVVNVESSHCYDSVPEFLAEVVRVLRPGGSFRWADFRPAGDVGSTRAQFRAAGLRAETEDDITAGVVRALDLDDDRRRALVRAWFPRVTHPALARFAALSGSRSHRAFQRRETVYLTARFGVGAPG